MAWRRKRTGSVRDRVLLSLQSEGVISLSNCVPASATSSKSQREMDSHTAVENHTDALVRNCYSVTDFENMIQSRQHNICGKTENGTLTCRNNKCLTNGDIERNHRGLRGFKNNSYFVRIEHKSTSSSYSSRGMH